jgi:hypothetical protein
MPSRQNKMPMPRTFEPQTGTLMTTSDSTSGVVAYIVPDDADESVHFIFPQGLRDLHYTQLEDGMQVEYTLGCDCNGGVVVNDRSVHK